jgi:hypothetical protein
MTVKKPGQAIITTDAEVETKRVIQRVIEIQEHTQWDLPVTRGQVLSGKSLDDWLSKKEDNAAVNLVERGIGYALKKRELGHGGFQVWVKESGRSDRSVRESMRVAQLLIQMSEGNAQRAAMLPYRKIQVLASAPPKMVDELFAAGALDDAANMEREEIKEILQLRRRCSNLEANLEIAEAKLGTKQKTPPRYPASVVHCRMESSTLSDSAIASVQFMRADIEHLLSAADLGTGKARNEYLRAAAGPMYINLMGVAAELHHLLQTIEKQFDGLLPASAAEVPMLDIDECRQHAEHRQLMLSTMSNERIARSNARAKSGQVKSQRGRPVGSGKKKTK